MLRKVGFVLAVPPFPANEPHSDNPEAAWKLSTNRITITFFQPAAKFNILSVTQSGRFYLRRSYQMPPTTPEPGIFLAVKMEHFSQTKILTITR